MPFQVNTSIKIELPKEKKRCHSQRKNSPIFTKSSVVAIFAPLLPLLNSACLYFPLTYWAEWGTPAWAGTIIMLISVENYLCVEIKIDVTLLLKLNTFLFFVKKQVLLCSGNKWLLEKEIQRYFDNTCFELHYQNCSFTEQLQSLQPTIGLSVNRTTHFRRSIYALHRPFTYMALYLYDINAASKLSFDLIQSSSNTETGNLVWTKILLTQPALLEEINVVIEIMQ